MSDTGALKCKKCGGPHATHTHYKWVEMPLEMPAEDILAELEKYADILNAMKTGGITAAEKALKKANMNDKKAHCFCGTPNHTNADHLRWLLDKESELSE